MCAFVFDNVAPLTFVNDAPTLLLLGERCIERAIVDGGVKDEVALSLLIYNLSKCVVNLCGHSERVKVHDVT